MIGTWFRQRKAKRTANSKYLTRQVKHALNSEVIGHLKTLGFVPSPFVTSKIDGLEWEPSNRMWQVELVRLTGDLLDEIWISLGPDHWRGSQIFVHYNRMRLVNPVQKLPLPPPRMNRPTGPLASAHHANSIDILDLHRRRFPKGLIPRLVMSPKGRFEKEWPRLRAILMAALTDLEPFEREWAELDTNPILFELTPAQPTQDTSS